MASVEVEVLVELCVVSVDGLVVLPDCAASLCGMELWLLFTEESVAAVLPFCESALVLCAASLLVVDELCAAAGFAGVVAWAIMCGVVELLLSDCGVVLVLGVVLLGVLELLSGVAVVVLAPVASVLEPLAELPLLP